MSQKEKSGFNRDKFALAQLAAIVSNAESPSNLRGMLLADIDAPYHSFDVLQIAANLENLMTRIADALCGDIDGGAQ